MADEVLGKLRDAKTLVIDEIAAGDLQMTKVDLQDQLNATYLKINEAIMCREETVRRKG